MHTELAASLVHLSAATAESMKGISERIGAVARAVSAGKRMRPEAFRAYYGLVPALLNGQEQEIEACLTRLEGLSERAPGLLIQHFGQPDAEVLSRDLIDDGMELAPISDTKAADFSGILGEGLDLMQRALPDLFGEIDAIVYEVLLAQAPENMKMEFDGASHYQFWGLLMLNPKHHKTPMAVVEVLAHEAAHSLLFGLTIEEPLVFNPDDDLYPSPLRVDPRPMDGIYHATFVSARMAWAMEHLAASGLLSADQCNEARDAAAHDRENFSKGFGVIEQYGRLSDTGDRVLNAAREWIAELN